MRSECECRFGWCGSGGGIEHSSSFLSHLVLVLLPQLHPLLCKSRAEQSEKRTPKKKWSAMIATGDTAAVSANGQLATREEKKKRGETKKILQLFIFKLKSHKNRVVGNSFRGKQQKKKEDYLRSCCASFSADFSRLCPEQAPARTENRAKTRSSRIEPFLASDDTYNNIRQYILLSPRRH